MNDISALWMIGLVSVLAGVVIGLIMARLRERNGGRDALQLELDEARGELQRYKQDVGVHFAQTADLVNRLTDSYRDVHQHLSKSAQKLCDDKVLVASLMAQEQRPVLTAPPEGADEEAPESAPVEPPKDYAPRKDPKEAGTLSEQYGLHRRAAAAADDEAPFDPSKTADHSPRDSADDSDQPPKRSS